MAKVALLIGVSEYEPGLTPLPAATKDVEAMRQVLENPEIGGFDKVIPLKNPQRQAMDEAIEALFANRQKDDLVLLFFSGHGIKDENGKLYFAACNTKKSEKGELVKATTVPANSVHSVMSNSRCKREVVILDCCFSGAFAEGMSAKDDGFVDIRNQLGGEGRAVLTSSTSTQYSFEQQGADTSTYTRYIVEGLKTGAADKNEDGWISVDELHEYATKAVQEATPAMKPEIYAIKEGYKINLAKAPIDDPKLIYRREVDYWVRDGEIINMGRILLTKRQKELGLKPDEASAIEAEVLKPFQDYKENLEEYQKAFIEATKSKLPVSDNTRADLKRLQQALGLRDEDIALIEAPIIAENSPSLPPPRFRNSNFKYYIGVCIIGIIGVVVGGTVVYFFRPPPQTCAKKEQYSLNDKISLGEEILLKQDTNPDKEAGVKAFAQGDCLTAIIKFQAYRAANLSDPEALIYLNNAKAALQGNQIKIAVSVPIGESPNIAKEILRGVAQVQNQVNSSNGINGKALEVAIANDDNDPTTASNIATEFVKDMSFLAVVGHNASRASIPAASVYQNAGLVMISPTSYSRNITSIGNYIFLTAPSVSSIVDSISRYAISERKKTNFLICVDKNPDNRSVKDRFIEAITGAGGTINPIDCNLDDSKFNPQVVLSQAIKRGANALVLALYIDKSRDKTGRSSGLIRANQGQLDLFGTPSMYTDETLERGQNINDITTSVPWHPTAFPNNPFASNAMELWKAPVTWRTATSYDAILAIVKGLQQSKTREDLQKALHSPGFSVNGATGKIQFFTQSGDRTNNSIFLVKVQQISGTDKYEFAPIQP
ncbi:ABC transporter substrate-binding protein [Nostoc sp.]|uniref:caspase, EACC1-associated type n=1 Tax=Nostoc sp. TaxID=1180 RepID=UPI002FFCA932